MKTLIEFEDRGQDFLIWEITDGVVTDCKPFQASIWVGKKIINQEELVAGGKVSFLIDEIDQEVCMIKYPLILVIHGLEPNTRYPQPLTPNP